MRWFSHRRKSGGRHNCITYLRTSEDRSRKKCRTRTAPQRTTPEQNSALFRFFVPGDLDLWALTSTFELGRDFCTVHITFKFHHPKFNHSEVIPAVPRYDKALSASLYPSPLIPKINLSDGLTAWLVWPESSGLSQDYLTFWVVTRPV